MSMADDVLELFGVKDYDHLPKLERAEWAKEVYLHEVEIEANEDYECD